MSLGDRPSEVRCWSRATTRGILPLVVLLTGLGTAPSSADDRKPPQASVEPVPGVFACHESIPQAIEGSPPLSGEAALKFGISKAAAQAWRARGWWFSARAPDAAPDAGPREVYVDPSGKVRIGARRVSVTLRPDVCGDAPRAESVERELGAKILYAAPDAPVVVVRVPLGRNPYEFARELAKRPNVEDVDVTTLSIAHGSGIGCEDSDRGREQWHLASGSGVDAGVKAAWETYGVSGAGRIVAVIDFDFLTSHEDLQPDLAASRKFVENAWGAVIDVVDVPPRDESGHGTRVAGVIGAIQGNGKGVCGVAPKAALRLISVQEGLSGEAMWRAIGFARNPGSEIRGFAGRGADVVSSSVNFLGPTGEDQWDAIGGAIGRLCSEGRGGLGAPFIWALPNESEEQTPESNPIAGFSYVISVGATTTCDEWLGGGFGSLVDLVAPGQEIVTTNSASANPYFADQGCSFAAPIVAGVAALVIERNPSLRVQDVWRAMRCSAKRLGNPADSDRFGHHPRFGWGRIDAKRAVGLAYAAPNLLCDRLWERRRFEMLRPAIGGYPGPMPDPPPFLPPRGTCPGLGDRPAPEPELRGPVHGSVPSR